MDVEVINVLNNEHFVNSPWRIPCCARYTYILDKMPIENNRLMRIKNLTNLANILGQDLIGTTKNA